MIVVYSDQRARFEAICSYFERSIPKEARWRWDPNLKRWYAASEDIARRLARYAGGNAALRLAALSPEEQRALTLSQAQDADIAVPAPAGLAYLPYQRAGIAYALAQGNALIADEMGLGKTIQAIGVVNSLPETRRVLIVCPAALRLNWRAEWRRWHTGPLRPTLLDEWPGGLFDHTRDRALIVSYDSVRKWHPQIADTEWDVLICDEAHLVKDGSTRRAKALFGGKYNGRAFEAIPAKRKLFLTGTAIVNRATDLWPLIHALAPTGLGGNRADFLERYGNHDRLDELHLRLRTQIMVRRKKDDVLKDLPAKRRQLILLDVEDASDALAAEARIVSLQRERIERVRTEIAGLPHAEQVMALRQCRAVALSEIARVRKETALRKLPTAVEHLHDVLGNVDKAIVFAHHHDVLDGLYSEFRRVAVQLDGRTSERERQLAVEAFQKDRGSRLFLGSIRAAGLGLTLTAAATVVFVELDWTPAAMTQAEDRAHRIGQHSPVLVQHLVIDGSLDAKMSRILIDKQGVMDAALDGGPTEERGRDILAEVLRA